MIRGPLLWVILFLGFVAFLGHLGQSTGQFDSMIALALLLLSSIGICALLLWRSDHTFRQVDAQRHQAEMRLRGQHEKWICESEERYRLLTEALPHTVWTMRTDLTLEFLNRRAYEFTGLTVDQVNHRGWEQLIHPDDRPGVMQVSSEPLQRGEAHQAEYRIRRHDGEYRWVISHVVPLKQENGEVKKWIGTTYDIHDRRLVQDQLRESERRYRALVQATPQVVWTVGGKGDEAMTWWTEMTGQPAPESAGWGWLDAVHPDDRERVRATWEDAFQMQTIYDTEYRIRHRSGEYRHFSVRGVPLFGSQGELQQWVGTLTDITDRKRIEEALKGSERRFRLLLEGLPQLVWTCKADGQCDYLSRQWVEYTGIPEAEQLGYGWSNALHADDRPHALERWKQAAESGIPLDVEFRIRNAAGEYRWFKTRAVSFTLEDGTTKWFGTNTDFHDEKRIEEELKQLNATLEQRVAERTSALREQDERFRSAFDFASIGMALVSLDGRWLRVNSALCELVGYREQELLTTDFQSITHPEDLLADLTHVQEVIDGKIRSYQMEKRYFHKNGHLVHILLSVSLVRDGLGNPLYFVSQILDITQRKKAEKQMIASLQEKEVLLKEIHHRVKNNLQIVSTLLDLQSDHTTDPLASEMFQESRGRVKSMALIHERLYRAVDLAHVNFAEYVRQLADDLYNTYKVSSDEIILEVNVDMPSLPIDIAIPCGLLLNELMSNCLKHGFRDRQDGHIRIDFRRVENTNIISVADDGVGFPPDFDWRATTSFGLQLVHTLVDQIKGNLELITQPGTRFIIRFSGH